MNSLASLYLSMREVQDLRRFFSIIDSVNRQASTWNESDELPYRRAHCDNCNNLRMVLACARLSDSREVAKIKHAQRKSDGRDSNPALFPAPARFSHHFLPNECTTIFDEGCCVRKGHFRDPKTQTFKGQARNHSCENEFYLHENEKSFPYQRMRT